MYVNVLTSLVSPIQEITLKYRYDRCGDFLDSLLTNGADHSLFSRFRVDRPQWRDHGDYNTLIVTHGLTMRLMLMRYFQMSVGT